MFLTAIAVLALTAAPDGMVPFSVSGDGVTVTVGSDGGIRLTQENEKEQFIGTLDASGKVVVAGKTMARIAADGTIELLGKHPQRLGKLDDKGRLKVRAKNPELTVGFDADGLLVGSGDPSPVKVSPANNATVNRRAMLMYLLVMTGV